MTSFLSVPRPVLPPALPSLAPVLSCAAVLSCPVLPSSHPVIRPSCFVLLYSCPPILPSSHPVVLPSCCPPVCAHYCIRRRVPCGPTPVIRAIDPAPSVDTGVAVVGPDWAGRVTSLRCLLTPGPHRTRQRRSGPVCDRPSASRPVPSCQNRLQARLEAGLMFRFMFRSPCVAGSCIHNVCEFYDQFTYKV